MSKQSVHFSSDSNEWGTPQPLFDKYNDIYNFEIDVSANDINAKCDTYFTKDDNALEKDWKGKVCWMNPPYGREIALFMKKAYEESLKGATVVCLVPSRTDTRWWHDCAMKGEIEFIKGRIKFVNLTDKDHKANSAPFPSAVIVFNWRTTHEH